jgi:hypothetical protein
MHLDFTLFIIVHHFGYRFDKWTKQNCVWRKAPNSKPWRNAGVKEFLRINKNYLFLFSKHSNKKNGNNDHSN